MTMYRKVSTNPLYAIIAIVALTLTLAGCHKENNEIFTATTQSYSSSKTHFEGSGIAYWDDGDMVTINDKSFTVTIDGDDNNKATIAVSDLSPYGDYYYAAYPANRATISTDGTITFTIPKSEVYTPNTNGNQVIHNIMAAKTQNTRLEFYNMCAMLHFQIKGSGSGIGKKLMAIEVSSDKPLSGTVTVNGNNMTSTFSGAAADTAKMLTFSTPYILTADPHDFYIQIPATTNASHFRVCYIIEDGTAVKVFEKTKAATTSFSSSHLYNFGEDVFDGTQLLYTGNIAVNPLVMDGSEANPYLVSSETIWDAIKSNFSNSSKYVTLVNDITVSTSYRNLKAHLNGNGNTITLTNNNSLFDTIQGGTVKNLTLEGDIQSPTRVNHRFGALTCFATSSAIIENCINKANIESLPGKTNASTNVGGLCGYSADGCTIKKCQNNGNIISDAIYTGGIVGYIKDANIFDSCINYGHLSIAITNNESKTMYSGGIAGMASISVQSGSSLTISNFTNNGNIVITGATSEKMYCGGLFASLSTSLYTSLTVNSCNNVGNITYDTTATTSNLYFIGGLIAIDGSGTTLIINSFNEGDITTSVTKRKSIVGGLIGQAKKTSITNSYVFCNIKAYKSAGLIEDGETLLTGSTISNCYYYGTIIGYSTTLTYGIAGNSNSSDHFTIDYCHYPSTVRLCGSNNVDSGTNRPITSATDNAMLESLNNNKPNNNCYDWVLGTDNIVLQPSASK